MKTFLKIIGVLAGVVIIAVIGGLIYLNVAYPDVDPPKDIKVEKTSERLARGKYVATHVAICIECHSERDWTKFAGPIIPGSEGQGGEIFDENLGFPGKISAKNITPAAIGHWTDGELIRAITCGVNKDGDPLFPLMPYNGFSQMSQEDLYSVVAYIRSLTPKKTNISPTELDFPVYLIVRTIPLKTYTPAKDPDRSNTVAYGKYLVTLASCGECHTQFEKGELVPGTEFGGGREFIAPYGTLKSANITPHPETGIGKWTREQFIKRFKDLDPDSVADMPVKLGEFNTIMPWRMYAGMTKEDLGAIYDYLRTVKPIYNKVVTFTPPKKSMAVK